MNSRRFTWSPHWRGRAAWPALKGRAAAGLVGSPLGRRTTGEDEATPARDKRFRKLCAPFHKYRATGKRPQITPPGGVGPVHCGISVPLRPLWVNRDGRQLIPRILECPLRLESGQNSRRSLGLCVAQVLKQKRAWNRTQRQRGHDGDRAGNADEVAEESGSGR